LGSREKENIPGHLLMIKTPGGAAVDGVQRGEKGLPERVIKMRRGLKSTNETARTEKFLIINIGVRGGIIAILGWKRGGRGKGGKE